MKSMEPQKFLENIKNQYVDGEDIDINMDSNFRQIESYDSLTGMTIIVMIKDEYQIEITDKEYKSQNTIRDLYNLIKSKLTS